MQRTITAHLFHSLDGVVEDPHLWQFGAFGAEEGELMSRSLAPVTHAVIGRRLWHEWREFWPGADDPFAQWINPVRKHVISKTLPDDLPWNSTLISGDPSEYVRRLGDEADGDIAIVGGIETIRSLFLAGVIDQLTLTTHPVVVGQGRRLFDGAVPPTRLRLLHSQQTASGNIVLTYALRPTDQPD